MSFAQGSPISFGSSSTVLSASGYALPIFGAIIGIVLIVVIVMVIVQHYKNSPVNTLQGPVDLYTPESVVVVKRDDTKKNMSGSYTLSCYLRLDAVPDMRDGATPLFTWPGVWKLDYNPAQEELIWNVDQTSSGNQSDLINREAVVLPHVPLQRWTQVTLAFEGRTMDLFVGGKLIKSHTLNNVPPSATASITIVPEGIRGKLAHVQLWSRRLTVSEVEANFIDTSDSQGRPYLGSEYFKLLTDISMPNIFCPSGNCTGNQPMATQAQTWEFAYA